MLYPEPGLSRPAFLGLLSALCVVSIGAGAAFVAAGFWPALALLSLDGALIYMVLRNNRARARTFETVRLTDSELIVRQVGPGRRRTWYFQSYWLRVLMDKTPGPDSALMLRSHGQSVEIGAFLSPGEKLKLAEALQTELRRLREGSA